MESKSFRNSFLKCFHNDKGYCKHRDQRWYQHFSKICQARHPRRCKDGETCRFFRRNICDFLHEEIVEVTNNEHNIKIHELETEVMSLKILDEQLMKENDVLTKKTKELKNIRNEAINLKNENSELKDEMLKAKSQVKIMKAEILCTNIENMTKYSILQESLLKEVESHKISKEAIVELVVEAQEAVQRLKKYSATIMVLLKENQDFKMTVE
eukprot:TRINITY_DN23788_c0_g1_i1.p1 TRINITY_DN23788_c0_g1~~TRINITY_DN23788_c0_g1_i1.p1  ORF type:complete len:212 (-),score=53.16 TRINITY_DN23788_c0_g1_i1:116-751(-)